jgi:hypothetical protein
MNDPDQSIIAYFAQRQVSRQWRPFLAALSDELFENLAEDQASGFLRQVGRRMAASLPLAPVETLEALEAEANRTLAELDWGVTQLAAGPEAVTITHRAFPCRLDQREGRHWPRALAAVSEGLYTAWMSAQGAGPVLAARAVGMSEPGTLELTYGASRGR